MGCPAERAPWTYGQRCRCESIQAGVFELGLLVGPVGPTLGSPLT